MISNQKTRQRLYNIMFISFFLIYVIIYGCMHFYFFAKVKSAFGCSYIYVFLFSALMISAPILIQLVEKNGLHITAKILAYTGYTWMGLLLLFCCASILVDFYRFFIYLSGNLLKSNLSLVCIIPRNSFLIPFLVSVVIVFYGYFEARNIKVERIRIKTPKLPKGINTLKIVQVSDIHLGIMVGEDRLREVIDLIKEISPDVLVSTGDLVDAGGDNLENSAGLLRELNPKYGKYAITGNHEFFAGLGRSVEFTEKSGFKMLRGEVYNVQDILVIAGLDDPAGRMYGQSREISEKELLSRALQEDFILLLKHRPEIGKDSIGLFDLQLSGHTHKGQIFPFNFIISLFYPKYYGFWELTKGSHLYVSRGAGTWGPMIRFLASPEITVVELYC